jgi:hypothetical protein
VGRLVVVHFCDLVNELPVSCSRMHLLKLNMEGIAGIEGVQIGPVDTRCELLHVAEAGAFGN